MAESALNNPHTRHCVSASKGLTFGEIIQVLKPSSSVSAAQEQAPKRELTFEPTCHEFTRAEKGVGWR